MTNKTCAVVFSWKAPAEGLWPEAARGAGPSGTAPGLRGKGAGRPGLRALRERAGVRKPGTVLPEVPVCQAVPVCAAEVPVGFPCPAVPRSPRRRGGVGPSPDFGLLPWEFDSAISWNMNLFICEREQT